jgi:hypothetical protein
VTELQSDKSELGRAALGYAEHGWPVFPCRPRGKEPYIGPPGFHQATTDLDTVREWWTRWPDANIGLYPGPAGLLVIDVDGPAGEAVAQALGLLSEPTLTSVSGRAGGGRHLYFRHPGFHVGNRDLGPHLNVRGDAGYVLVPPSVHPTGTRYRWAGRAEEIAPLPPRALDVLRAVQEGDAAVKAPIPRRIPIGQRNIALTSLAGALRRRGADQDIIRAALKGINAECCDPPLGDAEVEAIASSIARYPTGGEDPVRWGRTLRRRSARPKPIPWPGRRGPGPL